MSNMFEEKFGEVTDRARAFSDATLVRAANLREQTFNKAIDLRDQGLQKLGVQPEDLKKLNYVPLICATVSLLINFLLFAGMMNFAWIKGTALSGGQPFNAYLSLTAAQFGTPADPNADIQYFANCDGRHQCSLGALCGATLDGAKFLNDMPKDTPQEAWCAAARAGATALSLLWLGFIPGLAATAFTAMYASKEIEVVGRLVAKVEALNFTDRIQKVIICACWAALWLFMFVSMTVYAAMIPDTLGWGPVDLEASFGLLRLSFVLISLFGAILAANLFNLWNAENVVEAWMEFTEARLLSAKKALYLELMFQLALYLFLIIDEVDWSALLIVLAGFYLDAKNKNFLLMYLVLVTISILFDVIHLAELPSFDNMTPGESFGSTLWIIIFIFKPLILVTIYFYEVYEKDADGNGNAWNRFDDVGARDDEIAE